jgi:hypothetical protein
MKIIITREDNYRRQEYCILEFKGRFETDDLPTKCLVHLGTLYPLGSEQYRLEIGVMDLVGKAVKLEEGWLYTETTEGESYGSKIVTVKGVITRKILFDKRPCPNMERSEIEPKLSVANNLFKNMDLKGSQ